MFLNKRCAFFFVLVLFHSHTMFGLLRQTSGLLFHQQTLDEGSQSMLNKFLAIVDEEFPGIRAKINEGLKDPELVGSLQKVIEEIRKIDPNVLQASRDKFEQAQNDLIQTKAVQDFYRLAKQKIDLSDVHKKTLMENQYFGDLASEQWKNEVAILEEYQKKEVALLSDSKYSLLMDAKIGRYPSDDFRKIDEAYERLGLYLIHIANPFFEAPEVDDPEDSYIASTLIKNFVRDMVSKLIEEGGNGDDAIEPTKSALSSWIFTVFDNFVVWVKQLFFKSYIKPEKHLKLVGELVRRLKAIGPKGSQLIKQMKKIHNKINRMFTSIIPESSLKQFMQSASVKKVEEGLAALLQKIELTNDEKETLNEYRKLHALNKDFTAHRLKLMEERDEKKQAIKDDPKYAVLKERRLKGRKAYAESRYGVLAAQPLLAAVPPTDLDIEKGEHYMRFVNFFYPFANKFLRELSGDIANQ